MGTIEREPEIIDNLTSTSTIDALSANQGKVLDGKISNLFSHLKEVAVISNDSSSVSVDVTITDDMKDGTYLIIGYNPVSATGRYLICAMFNPSSSNAVNYADLLSGNTALTSISISNWIVTITLKTRYKYFVIYRVW